MGFLRGAFSSIVVPFAPDRYHHVERRRHGGHLRQPGANSHKKHSDSISHTKRIMKTHLTTLVSVSSVLQCSPLLNDSSHRRKLQGEQASLCLLKYPFSAQLGRALCRGEGVSKRERERERN